MSLKSNKEKKKKKLQCSFSLWSQLGFQNCLCFKTRQGRPVVRRPSTDEAPPTRKMQQFSKIAVTLEPFQW